MTKEELIAYTAERMKTDIKHVRPFFDAFCKTILSHIAEEDEINLAPIGKLKIVNRPAYKGRNPQTGEEMDVPACKVVRFAAGKALRKAVNE